jgi:phosphoribosylglycinamide formyltransferase-1
VSAGIDGAVSAGRLGILISGRGSNMEALAAACASGMIDAEIAVVISNVADAPGLDKARGLGLHVEVIEHRGLPRETHDARLSEALEGRGVSLVCLAGYMRLLTQAFMKPWEGRVVNVHPSLLPAFPGIDAQAQALAHGAKVSGCTVHFVDEKLDHGPIILQESVPVQDDDTTETLSARILAVEHRIYPEAVALVTSGRLRVEGRRVVRD